jgi:hypothetical protein
LENKVFILESKVLNQSRKIEALIEKFLTIKEVTEKLETKVEEEIPYKLEDLSLRLEDYKKSTEEELKVVNYKLTNNTNKIIGQ